MAAKQHDRRATATDDRIQAMGHDEATRAGKDPQVELPIGPQKTPRVYIGCAGWSIPKDHQAHFPIAGTHLERYAGRFLAVEINSSFYRPHRPETYERWAASVPIDFRFAVKVPREITHEHRLEDADTILDRFLGECNHLGDQLGPLLVQLPPTLAFNSDVANPFFATLRKRFPGMVVCEPRHRTWFSTEADHFLKYWRVARAAADPAVVPTAGEPAGWDQLVYIRLHGSPQMYYSSYSENYLKTLVKRLEQFVASATVWCIFDNTALGAATANALTVTEQLACTRLRKMHASNPLE